MIISRKRVIIFISDIFFSYASLFTSVSITMNTQKERYITTVQAMLSVSLIDDSIRLFFYQKNDEAVETPMHFVVVVAIAILFRMGDNTYYQK
jgi:hypothetical protein